MDMFDHSCQLFSQPAVARNLTFPSLEAHQALCGVEPAVPAVLVVDQPHRSELTDVFRCGQSGLFHERVVPRVDRHSRHADLVQPVLGAAALVVVVLVLEAVDASDVGFVEGSDGVARANGLYVERVGELLVLQLCLRLERLQEVLTVNSETNVNYQSSCH